VSITISVLVTPRATRPKFGPRYDGRIKIAISAPPVDGEANVAVIELLAKLLGISRSSITVISGKTSRRKTLKIEGVTYDQIEALL
jgi:uncharacterized protein (TIGR00251 family)